MLAFHTELRRGRGVAESLRIAQNALRSRRDFSHPHYWAAFSVHGDGR
jgi:CHAT domain-containing protein